MKVIFLDFDGVINSFQSELVDPECVGVLSAIIEETNAKVVATSASRYAFLEGKVDYLESAFYCDYAKTLQSYGIVVDDILPCINKDKEVEIQAYLKAHPDISEYLVLDDDYFYSTLLGHEIYIDFERGLSVFDFQPAIDILNDKLLYYNQNEIETDVEKRMVLRKYFKQKKNL